ncbi:23S rRNA (adenine(2030)-N(6))-methyltransferase RlmJ [Aestuariibacter sp. A3R04]|uniref:23S rRNA (adenine(2030)-N(6))-methyltransferase RlmJ n=1 Tax=Aestuariibacter sp. A3R04 TaxID=2841571 RepID=UPI00209148BE|nr:23S rRNA (adenine(2030)-N(6))-methyltransferase RlmJ [Aestuariibacter sp. A3R04]
MVHINLSLYEFCVLSYLHAFHAGNHADVIKHLCWLGVINYLKKKEKPFTVYDTHAGAGCYALTGEQMQKNREFETGFVPLAGINPQSSLLSGYLDAMTPHWENLQYAGSPLLAANALRAQDNAHFMELHPTESEVLTQVIRGVAKGNTHVHHRDGLEGVIALTPPSAKRGAILIDPPYERLNEYEAIPTTIRKILQRWAAAQIVLWYPLLSGRAGRKAGASEAMVSGLSNVGKTSFTAELRVADKHLDTGMYGSGVMVINPPWQLDAQLHEALDEVSKHLGPSVSSTINWVKKESNS